jgi:hypothetical protein
MPRRQRRRRRAPDVLTIEQAAELTCGPSWRGSWFASPAERARLRRLYALPASRAVAARERQLDAARARGSASSTPLVPVATDPTTEEN